MPIHLSSKEDYGYLLDKYDTWMFDCDGVLWCEDRTIDGAVDALNILRNRGKRKRLLFVTNNTTKSRKTHKGRFDQLGVPVTMDEICGSAYATAVYISSVMKLPKDKKVYVIGMSGLEEELKNEDISFIGGTDPADNTLEPFNLADFTLDPDVAAVICGFDLKINYTKLSKAFQYLTRNPGCQFVAANADVAYPCKGGMLPGGGCIIAPLRFALGRDPIIIGKPEKMMMNCIREKVDFDPARAIMVGDRLDTDILFGQACGLATLLVLTGGTSKEDISGPHASSIAPEYVTASIGDLRALGSS